MDASEGLLGSGDEPLAIPFNDRVLSPATQASHGLAATATAADDFSHLRGDGLTIFHPERIGISHRAADDGVALGRPLIGLDENLTKQADFVEFVDGKHAIGVIGLGHVHESERGEVALEERKVGGLSGDALVAIDERLEIGQLNHREKRLFKRVTDFARLGQDEIEERLDQCGDGGRQVGRFANAHWGGAQGPFRSRIPEQIGREQRVQVENGTAVEPCLRGGFQEEFNRGLVI